MRRFPRWACSLFALGLLPLGNMAPANAAVMSFTSDRDTIVLQATGKPAGSSQQYNDLNFGNAGGGLQFGTAGGLGSAGNEVRTLISFDVSALPAYDQINSVTLRLFRNDTSQSLPNGFTAEVHQISLANAGWIEGTGDGGGITPGNDIGPTWNQLEDATNVAWAGSQGLKTGGTDYDTTVLSSESFTSATVPAVDDYVDFVFDQVTPAQLKDMIDGWMTTNPGLLLFPLNRASLSGNERVRFYSQETGGTNLQPLLLIDFTASALSAVPEPSAVLLVALGLAGLCGTCRPDRWRLS